MSIWQGILLLIRAGSFAHPHVDGLSSVNDEYYTEKMQVVCRCAVVQAHMGSARMTNSVEIKVTLITTIPSLVSRELFGSGSFPSWARDMFIFPLSSLSLQVRGARQG